MFYVNVPIAVIVIALAARTIPQIRSGRKPVIDYLGIVFVALGDTRPEADWGEHVTDDEYRGR